MALSENAVQTVFPWPRCNTDAIRVRPRSRLMVSFRSLGIIGPGKILFIHWIDPPA